VRFALVRMHDIHGATWGRPAYRAYRDGKTAGFGLILGECKEKCKTRREIPFVLKSGIGRVLSSSTLN